MEHHSVMFYEITNVESLTTTTDLKANPKFEKSPLLVVSPNPFYPSVNIRVYGWKSGAALRVLDVNGRVVAELTSALNSRTGGTIPCRIVWNASGCAPGVYLVLLRQGNAEVKRRILLIR